MSVCVCTSIRENGIEDTSRQSIYLFVKFYEKGNELLSTSISGGGGRGPNVPDENSKTSGFDENYIITTSHKVKSVSKFSPS